MKLIIDVFSLSLPSASLLGYWISNLIRKDLQISSKNRIGVCMCSKSSACKLRNGVNLTITTKKKLQTRKTNKNPNEQSRPINNNKSLVGGLRSDFVFCYNLYGVSSRCCRCRLLFKLIGFRLILCVFCWCSTNCSIEIICNGLFTFTLFMRKMKRTIIKMRSAIIKTATKPYEMLNLRASVNGVRIKRCCERFFFFWKCKVSQQHIIFIAYYRNQLTSFSAEPSNKMRSIIRIWFTHKISD